jgi:midasin
MDLSQNPHFSRSLEAIIDNHEAKEELGSIWSQIKNNAKAQQLLARLVAMEYADNEIRRSAEKLKLGNLTVLQQSYCFVQGRVNENQLSHPIIQSLYTTLETTKQTVLNWINNNGYLNASEEV